MLSSEYAVFLKIDAKVANVGYGGVGAVGMRSIRVWGRKNGNGGGSL
jgi:hypothetical protein